MAPVLRAGQTKEILRTLWIFADYVTNYTAFSAQPMPSLGTEADVKLFRDITRAPEAINLETANQTALDDWKRGLLDRIGNSLRQPLFILLVVAQVLALIRLGQVCWTRQPTYPLVLAAAAWGGSLAYLLVNAVVHVTSFSLVAVSTFWPVYPLLQVFTLAAFWDAAQ